MKLLISLSILLSAAIMLLASLTQPIYAWNSNGENEPIKLSGNPVGSVSEQAAILPVTHRQPLHSTSKLFKPNRNLRIGLHRKREMNQNLTANRGAFGFRKPKNRKKNHHRNHNNHNHQKKNITQRA